MLKFLDLKIVGQYISLLKTGKSTEFYLGSKFPTSSPVQFLKYKKCSFLPFSYSEKMHWDKVGIFQFT